MPKTDMVDRLREMDFFDTAILGRRLIFLCDWLPPDFGAVGQYTMMRSEVLARSGRSVNLYGLSSADRSPEDRRFGDGHLRIVRLKSRPVPKDSLFRRLIWTLRTNVRLLAASLQDIRSADTIIFTGAPPFLIHFLVPLNMIFRRQLVYRITDFHPECFMVSLERTPLLLSFLYRVTIWLRRRVDLIEVLGEDQSEKLHTIGIDPKRIILVRDPSPVRFTGDERALPVPDSLRGYVILLYSGNLGMAHDIETFLKGYELHHRNGSGNVGLWLCAVGTKVDALSRALEERALPFHRGVPVALEKLAALMVSSHAHLITLSDPFVGFVVPSKIYACVQSGRHLLYIGSSKSDVHKIGAEGLSAGKYHRVAVGDVEGVAKSLDEIAAQVCKSAGPQILDGRSAD